MAVLKTLDGVRQTTNKNKQNIGQDLYSILVSQVSKNLKGETLIVVSSMKYKPK